MPNPDGGPTPDKPDITLRTPEATDTVSALLNIRVADIAAFYTMRAARAPSYSPNPSTAMPSSAATCATRMAT